MQLNELILDKDIQNIRPSVEAANLDFKLTVDAAREAANKAIPIPTYQSFVSEDEKTKIISFVIDFIWKLIDAEMNKPAKKKGGKFVRFVWSILGLLNIKQKAKTEIGKI